MKRKCRKFIIGALIIMSVSLATSNAFAISSNQSNENQEILIDYGFLPEKVLIKDIPNGDISQYVASKIQIRGSFVRSSGKGIASVSAVRAGASKMKSTITLQVYNGKKYVNTNTKSATLSKNGTTISQTATFSVSSGKKYRIKIAIVATVGGSTESSVAYRNLN